PTANIGSTIGYLVMMFGLILGSMKMFIVGVALFSMVLLFQLVTLPVEFDASARAKKLAVASGIVTGQERDGMDRGLNAAALTYVAAAISTLLTLLYFLVRAGLLGGRRAGAAPARSGRDAPDGRTWHLLCWLISRTRLRTVEPERTVQPLTGGLPMALLTA